MDYVKIMNYFETAGSVLSSQLIQTCFYFIVFIAGTLAPWSLQGTTIHKTG